MSKRTIGLIVALFVITIILLAIALESNVQITKKTAMTPSPTPYATSVLSFTSNTLYFTRGITAPLTLGIQLNTGGNDVTGVQLELSYEPSAFSSISITNGSLFSNPVVIFSPKVDATEGTISYAYGITPAQAKGSHKRVGTVALLTLIPATHPVDAQGKPITQTQIKFLPKSAITARGVDPSVMSKTTFQNTLTIDFASSTASASFLTR